MLELKLCTNENCTMECFMNSSNKFLLIVLMLLISACQTTPTFTLSPVKPIDNVYLDQAFIGHDLVAVESEQEIFALDDEMKALVTNKLLRVSDIRQRSVMLLEHIFETENINLQYQGGANLTASQTYHQGQANCMSLTIMAYSLAKAAKLNVNFQNVQVPEYWQRNGDMNMLTGHVNLVIKKRENPNKIILLSNEVLEIDFDPYVAKKSFPRKVITKNEVLAMFYNNKGAQALAKKDYTNAYRYIKAATLADNSFSSAWGNLGVLYKVTGHNEHALFTYHKAVALNKNNNTAMNNLSILLRKQGEHDLAEKIELSILRKRINNPYYYALLADESLQKGNIEFALLHYQKAIHLDDRIDEFYHGLAKVYYAMDNYSAARRALKKAMAINKVSQIDNQYLAKLNFLKQAEYNPY